MAFLAAAELGLESLPLLEEAEAGETVIGGSAMASAGGLGTDMAIIPYVAPSTGGAMISTPAGGALAVAGVTSVGTLTAASGSMVEAAAKKGLDSAVDLLKQKASSYLEQSGKRQRTWETRAFETPERKPFSRTQSELGWAKSTPSRGSTPRNPASGTRRAYRASYPSKFRSFRRKTYKRKKFYRKRF